MLTHIMRSVYCLWIVVLISGCSQTPSMKSAERIEDSREVLFYTIFKVLNIQVDPTLEAMNAYAQQHWLRKPGSERWEMQASQYQRKAVELKPIFKQLKMIDEVKPQKTEADYAVVLGATVPAMRARLQYLMRLIDEGVLSPKKIVVLTGFRQLDKEREKSSVLLDRRFACPGWKPPSQLPKNECDAAKFVWRQLPKSKKVTAIPLQFVSTKMLEKDGKSVRPATGDIVQTWLGMWPQAGCIVAVSNNPYISFQEEAMKVPLIKSGWFKNGGSLEVIGEGASFEHMSVAVQLDNIARYMYSILETQKAERVSR